MEQINKISIGVFIIAVLVIAYLIFFQGKTGVTPTEESPIAPASFEGLTLDERAALNPPQPDATDEEKQQYSQLVQRLAQEPAYLEIGEQCRLTPLVLRVKQDEVFTVRNNDTVEHTIAFFIDRYIVPPGGTQDIVADLGNELGIYGYGCDASLNIVGLILVTAVVE